MRSPSRVSFYVTGTEGPLLGGEALRAHQWAERVALLALATSRARSGPRELHPAR